jgi:hypothetical protein
VTRRGSCCFVRGPSFVLVSWMATSTTKSPAISPKRRTSTSARAFPPKMRVPPLGAPGRCVSVAVSYSARSVAVGATRAARNAGM